MKNPNSGAETRFFFSLSAVEFANFRQKYATQVRKPMFLPLFPQLSLTPLVTNYFFIIQICVTQFCIKIFPRRATAAAQ
jgi:hypothetical protein